MRILLLLTLFFGLHSCSAQSDVEDKLIGKWIMTAESDSFPEDIEKLSIGGSDLNSEALPEIILTFKSDNSLLINQMGNESNSNFKLKDSILTMGNRKYVLMKIGDEKLILKEKDGLFDNQYEYKKLTN